MKHVEILCKPFAAFVKVLSECTMPPSQVWSLVGELDEGVMLDPRDVSVPWETTVACPVAGAEEGSSGDVDSSSASSDSENSSEVGTAMDAEEAVTQPEGSSREAAPPGREQKDEKDADDQGKDGNDAKDDEPEFKKSYSRPRPKRKHIF